MADQRLPKQHHMGRRCPDNDYSMPGMYHITLRAAEGLGRSFGSVAGDAREPDGSANAPHVELTAIGRMVEQELLNSIREHYPMIEVQDYVVMPEHMHFIIEVHSPIVSKNGHKQHLGQVMAGFKKGCNHRYWALTGQEPASGRGKPAGAGLGCASAGDEGGRGKPAGADLGCAYAGGGVIGADGVGGGDGLRGAVYPHRWKVPSRGTTGRQPLFAPLYVDVIPLRSGMLSVQRKYIHDNPRSRLLRSTYPLLLQPRRSGIDTALTLHALMGYLRRECHASQMTPDIASQIESRLLISNGLVDCHSYGDQWLLQRRLLPVVCHRCDRGRFAQQKECCMAAARGGAVLVSARIAKGEQAIMDDAMAEGLPVVLLLDNGMPEVYHPSAERMERCLAGRLLLVTPWRYQYRSTMESITVAECKAMNCVVQALCRMRDDWWKGRAG